MITKDEVWCMEEYDGLLKADGFDDAIIGVAEGIAIQHKSVLIYDKDKILCTLMDRDGMTDEEAIEYYEFNIAGAYVGEKTPIFMERIENEWLLDNCRWEKNSI